MTAVEEKKSAAPTSVVRPGPDRKNVDRREVGVKILGYAAMVIALVIIVLPLYWIVMTSFKERPEIYTQPATWWPSSLHPENYSEATTSVPFLMVLRNASGDESARFCKCAASQAFSGAA